VFSGSLMAAALQIDPRHLIQVSECRRLQLSAECWPYPGQSFLAKQLRISC